MNIVFNKLIEYLKRNNNNNDVYILNVVEFEGVKFSLGINEGTYWYAPSSSFDEILTVNGVIEKIIIEREKNKHPNFTRNYDKIIDDLVYNCISKYILQNLTIAAGIRFKELIPIKNDINLWKKHYKNN